VKKFVTNITENLKYCLSAWKSTTTDKKIYLMDKILYAP
jgi:hypothetical protein